MGNHFGRGAFDFYVGSLVFAVFGLTGVLPIILTIGGVIMMVVGVVQMIYHFSSSYIQNKLNTERGGETVPLTSKTLELQDPNFDPNIYATTYVTIDESKTSFDDVSNPSQYGLSTPRY